jgi:hypothetical protein
MPKLYEYDISGYKITKAIPILSNTAKVGKLTELSNNTIHFTDHITAIANPNCRFESSHSINFIHFDSSKSVIPDQPPIANEQKLGAYVGVIFNNKTRDRHIKTEKHRQFITNAKHM